MTTTIINGVEFAVITVDEANDHGYAIDDFGEPVYLASHDLGAAVISWTGDCWVCDLEAADGLLGQGVGDTPEQALDAALDWIREA